MPGVLPSWGSYLPPPKNSQGVTLNPRKMGAAGGGFGGVGSYQGPTNIGQQSYTQSPYGNQSTPTFRSSPLSNNWDTGGPGAPPQYGGMGGARSGGVGTMQPATYQPPAPTPYGGASPGGYNPLGRGGNFTTDHGNGSISYSQPQAGYAPQSSYGGGGSPGTPQAGGSMNGGVMPSFMQNYQNRVNQMPSGSRPGTGYGTDVMKMGGTMQPATAAPRPYMPPSSGMPQAGGGMTTGQDAVQAYLRNQTPGEDPAQARLRLSGGGFTPSPTPPVAQPDGYAPQQPFSLPQPQPMPQPQPSPFVGMGTTPSDNINAPRYPNSPPQMQAQPPAASPTQAAPASPSQPQGGNTFGGWQMPAPFQINPMQQQQMIAQAQSPINAAADRAMADLPQQFGSQGLAPGGAGYQALKNNIGMQAAIQNAGYESSIPLQIQQQNAQGALPYYQMGQNQFNQNRQFGLDQTQMGLNFVSPLIQAMFQG